MTKLKKLFFLLSLATFLCISGCTDNPLEINENKDILDPQNKDQVKDTTLYAIKDTTYLTKTKINNEYGSRILIGSFDGLEARPIFRFTNLPKGAIFEEASIRFKAKSVLSDENAQPFTATAYPVNNLWISNIDSVWNNYTQNFDPNLPLGEIEITPDTKDTTLVLNSDGLDKFTFWADTANLGENYGVILDFTNANFIKFFSSLNADTDPTLFFTYSLINDTTVYTDSVSATYDGFVYQGKFHTDTSLNNYSSTLHVYSTLLKFDLAGFLANFPQEIDILSANLQMPVDLSNSLLDPTYSTNLIIYNLAGKITSDSVVVDSVNGHNVAFNHWAEDSTYIEVANDGNRSKLARTLILPQLKDLDSSFGFLIDFNSKTDFYSYIAFNKRNQQNQQLAPRLIITYRIPPKQRL